MNRRAAIALHKNELDTLGVEVLTMQKTDNCIQDAHRDDHYMLILLQKGTISLEVDFTPIRFKGPSLCFVAPGQVHRYLERKHFSGFFIFIDTSLVADQYRGIFATYEHFRQVVPISEDDLMFSCTLFLNQLLSQERHSLSAAIVASQVHTLLGIASAHVMQSGVAGETNIGQRYNIAKQFKQLIKENFKTLKQVQQYAAALNITPLYLNEVIKELTGFPASFWIQQEVILEAQRMLYYTSLDVKQIAWELGYEDHAYFSRFFKKHTGMTALAFRTKNHDLSNHAH